MKVLSFDQATKITAYSIFEDKNLINYGTLNAKISEKNVINRMNEMYFLIKNLIDRIRPDFVALEGVQFQSNQMVYSTLSQMQGVIFSILFERNINFMLIEPSSWKSFCKIAGKKRDEQKANTIKFVKEKYGIDVSEDEADALSLGHYVINNISLK